MIGVMWAAVAAIVALGVLIVAAFTRTWAKDKRADDGDRAAWWFRSLGNHPGWLRYELATRVATLHALIAAIDDDSSGFPGLTLHQARTRQYPLSSPAKAPILSPQAGDGPGPVEHAAPSSRKAAAPAPGPGTKPWRQPCAPTGDMWGDDVTGHVWYADPIGAYPAKIAAMGGE